MPTELQKGMLLGYLINAPQEIQDIASLVLNEISDRDKKDALMNTDVWSLCVPVRTLNVITHGGDIKTIGDLTKRSEAEMFKIPRFGRKSLNELKEALMEKGLRFGMIKEDDYG